MLSDSEDYEDSDTDQDLSIRSLEVTKSPPQGDLLALLECPVCFELPLPPIRTCFQGHILCSSCSAKLVVCPLCQQHIGQGRNYFAEDFVNKSIVRCRYAEDGCGVELPGAAIKGHVDRCEFRPLKCRQCNKKVAFSDIEDHLLKEHRIGRWDINEEGFRISVCQKKRTRNPNNHNEVIIDNGEGRRRTCLSQEIMNAILFSITISAFVAADFYLLWGWESQSEAALPER